jgi:poly-gamma-glutamate synthesis protein (capsule biosynthesis protein)
MSLATLTAVGDVFLGDSPFCYGFGVRSCLQRSNRREIVRRLSELLGPADCHFANLECVMSDAGSRPWNIGSLEIRGAPHDIELLVASGWRVLNLANNHAFQHGMAAFEDTVERLRAAGISVTGSAMEPLPTLVNCGGLDVMFTGYSLRPEQYRSNETIPYSIRSLSDDLPGEIRTLRAGFGGVLVCSLHWGHELLDRISREQREFAHAIIDAGADIVIGHHSHVLQGVERYRKGLIAYSLGNFVFDFTDPRTRETGVLRVVISEEGVVSHSFTPAVIGRDYFPRPANREEAARIMERLASRSAELTSGFLPDDSDLALEQQEVYAAYRASTYRSFLTQGYRFHPYFFMSSLVRAALRRLHIIHNP